VKIIPGFLENTGCVASRNEFFVLQKAGGAVLLSMMEELTEGKTAPVDNLWFFLEMFTYPQTSYYYAEYFPAYRKYDSLEAVEQDEARLLPLVKEAYAEEILKYQAIQILLKSEGDILDLVVSILKGSI
jgi:hypothetical protein